MASELEQDVDFIKHDLMAVKVLVEILYCIHFTRLPDGIAKFKTFSEGLKSQSDATVVLGADPALADHVSQGFLESISEILDRIDRRLADPQWQGS